MENKGHIKIVMDFDEPECSGCNVVIHLPLTCNRYSKNNIDVFYKLMVDVFNAALAKIKVTDDE